MTRSLTTGILAALAVLAAALPLRHLFTEPTFLRTALVVVAVSAVVGMVARALTSSVVLIFGAQLIALVETLAVLFCRDTLRYGLPTTATATRAGELLVDSRDTITHYAAPAPTSAGIVFAVTAIVGLIAVSADLAGATADSPAMAGMPVVALYGISAANAPGGLPWLDFALPAGLWLLLLAYRSQDDLRRWVSHVSARPGEEHRGTVSRDFAGQGVALAAAGLALALVVPALVPHLPPTTFGTGLRPDADGGADGRAEVAISSEIDLRRSMQDQDPSPVLRYETDDPSPPPLRVGVAREFVDGRAEITSTGQLVTAGDPTELDVRATEDDVRTTTITQSRIRGPQLPTPFAATSIEGPEQWSMDTDGVVRTAEGTERYVVTYEEPLEDPELVAESAQAADDTTGPAGRQPYLQLDDEIRVELESLDAQVVPADATDLQAAQAIQGYLRGSDFTYSLELEPRRTGEHPVSHFLRTRQGYCQQFAAAMVHLARARGIPARFVVGFLPGAPSGTPGERVVRAADAHAWPELYIDGVGWLRFEPTPGGRAASVPGYSIERDEATTSTSSTTTATASPTPTQEASPEVTGETAPGTGWWRPLLWALGALALLAVLPLTALVLRERARRSPRSPADRVEADWQRLVTDLGDLGIQAPAGATPRAAGESLVREAAVGHRSAEQVRRVVDTLERSRYAPTSAGPDSSEADQVSRDVDDLVARVQRSRSGGRRLRTALAPRSAVRWWGGLPGRVAARARGQSR